MKNSSIDFFPKLINEKKFSNVTDNLTIFVEEHNENGNLEGKYEEFHINGKIAKRGKYSSNIKIGEWFEFSKRGLLKKRIKHD